MSIYFDAVLDQRFNPIFNGTPEKVVEWLESITPISDWQVTVGKSEVTIPVATYLQAHKEKQQITRERKRAMVRDLVMDVLEEVKVYGSSSKDAIVNTAVENIMGAFGEGEQ